MDTRIDLHTLVPFPINGKKTNKHITASRTGLNSFIPSVLLITVALHLFSGLKYPTFSPIYSTHIAQ